MHVCLLSWMPCLSMLAQNYSDTKLLRLLRKEAERLLLSQAWKNVPKKGRTTSRMLAMHHLVDTRDYFIACRRRSTHSDLKKEFNFIPTRKLCTYCCRRRVRLRKKSNSHSPSPQLPYILSYYKIFLSYAHWDIAQGAQHKESHCEKLETI